MTAISTHSFPISILDVNELNQRFQNSKPEELLVWSRDTFQDKAVVTSSFQTQSLPLLHLISIHSPDMEVAFVDTGYHFPETLEYKKQIESLFGLTVTTLSHKKEEPATEINHIPPLYSTNPDLCCKLHKVDPVQHYLKTKSVWINGIRRDQTKNRETLNRFQKQPDGIIRVHPMLDWTQAQIDSYIANHNLPCHPLHEHGYKSIGCYPCTKPVVAVENERSGRWQGHQKEECGLHWLK